MAEVSTIQLKKSTIKELKKSREYPRQTYNELLDRMIKFFLQSKQMDQYDRFLHAIQQPKMKELWDNKEDEVWEHA